MEWDDRRTVGEPIRELNDKESVEEPICEGTEGPIGEPDEEISNRETDQGTDCGKDRWIARGAKRRAEHRCTDGKTTENDREIYIKVDR